jgi:uncharacterized iron-regulated membrane protein
MSLTGLMLAFEPQIVDFAEQSLRNISPPGREATRLSMGTILAGGREAFPGLLPSGVFMKSERTSSVAVSFGQETIFINPYTGDVIGKGSKSHQWMHLIEDWHRWLGSREIGKPITGISNAAFLILVLTGLYLWWPKRWTAATLKTITLFNPRLGGKAREWNRHNVIGFWSAPLLLVITLTGLIMSYPWANNLLYRFTGNEPPPAPIQGASPQSVRSVQDQSVPFNIDLLWARAEQQAPGWVSIRLRFPPQTGGPVIASIQEPDRWHPNPRSQLTLNPVTAEVVKWERYSDFNLGRKFRAWVRPLHTGMAAGLPGQVAASLGAFGGVMLVWTGLAMAWRRIFQRRPGSVPASQRNDRAASFTAIERSETEGENSVVSQKN